MAGDYDPYTDIWPAARSGTPVVPVRVGIDARTGRMIAGWAHTEQSIGRLFSTRYHERVLRRWCGSFVPHLIGKNTTTSTITRFWWAIATAIELWEPCYAVQRINIKNRDAKAGDTGSGDGILTSVDDIRRGNIAFRTTGLWMPRGHLGDRTPAGQKDLVIIGAGNGLWNTSTE
jgi:phage baseplate assembly protein W